MVIIKIYQLVKEAFIIKISDLLGLPVLEQSSCEQLGEVQEVMIYLSQALVRALIITATGWFTGKKILPIHDISLVRDTDLSIDEKEKLQPFEAAAYEGFADILDRPLMTDSGIRIGVVADLSFDLATGSIEDYVISDGIVTDLVEGRRRLPFQLSRIFQADKIIVADDAAELLLPQ